VDGVGDDHESASVRKVRLTASVRSAMLLVSLYVRRILTASREAASSTTSAGR
jgi:hypothetical protein